MATVFKDGIVIVDDNWCLCGIYSWWYQSESFLDFTCIGNVGPGLGMAGPLSNFSMFSDLSKIVLSFAMLIGRLEIYPIIIFIVPLFATRKTKRHRD